MIYPARLLPMCQFGSLCRDSETLRQALDTNCIGAHRVTQAFLPLLQAGSQKTVINVSTLGASLNWNAEQVSTFSAKAGIFYLRFLAACMGFVQKQLSCRRSASNKLCYADGEPRPAGSDDAKGPWLQDIQSCLEHA